MYHVHLQDLLSLSLLSLFIAPFLSSINRLQVPDMRRMSKEEELKDNINWTAVTDVHCEMDGLHKLRPSWSLHTESRDTA